MSSEETLVGITCSLSLMVVVGRVLRWELLQRMCQLEEPRRDRSVASDLPFDESPEPDRLRSFIAEIEAEGFKRIGPREWEGPIRRSLVEAGHTDADDMTLIFRPSWPYWPPLLRVPGIASWHADQENLCIWRGDDSSQRWTTLQGLYDRIDEWVTHAKEGFADVENARNPEIYWHEPAARVGLVDLDDLLGSDRADGQHGEFHFTDARSASGRPSPFPIMDISPGPFTAMTPLPNGITDHGAIRGRWFYRLSVAHPPRNLDELESFLTEKQRKRLNKDLRDRPFLMFMLVWHNQAGAVGTTVLATPEQSGKRAYHLVALRPKGTKALLLRAGPDADAIQDKKVAIIGNGAIGSFVADQLARSGVRVQRLHDYDLLWPANLIRHAAPPGTPAGMPKTSALKENLEQYPWVTIDAADPSAEGAVWTINGIKKVIESNDLTIDATGHGGLAELVSRVAIDCQKPFISVALFRGGAVARVRRQGLEGDAPFVQRPYLGGYPEIPPLDEEGEYVGTETGCLAQVYNAPPSAVVHAAVIAAEVVLDYLTGRNEQPDEIIEVMRLGDAPFNRLGRLRPEDLPAVVDVSERAQEAIQQAARRAYPDETGGVLLGAIVDGRPVVADAVEIKDVDATPISYRVGEGKVPEQVARSRDRDPRLGYLGEWHSHAHRTGPSPKDTVTMLTIAEESDTEAPVLLLARPQEDVGKNLQGFVTTPAGLKPAEVAMSGGLPPDDS
jgi:proteasome lid subunit RPN8/RPN11